MKTWLKSILGGVVGAAGVIVGAWWISQGSALAWIEDHEGLAAWIQAIFSVIAIGVTGWALVRQERRQAIQEEIARYEMRGDELESLTAISGQLEELISQIRFEADYFVNGYVAADWEAVARALKRVPVHKARDTTIAKALITLATESESLRHALLAYIRAENAPGPAYEGFRLWNHTYQAEIIGSMGAAVSAHQALCRRLERVKEKREAAEKRLRWA